MCGRVMSENWRCAHRWAINEMELPMSDTWHRSAPMETKLLVLVAQSTKSWKGRKREIGTCIYAILCGKDVNGAVWSTYSFCASEKLAILVFDGWLRRSLSEKSAREKRKMERGQWNNKPKQWKEMVMLVGREKYFSPVTCTTNSQ